jgi:hypothetical protein
MEVRFEINNRAELRQLLDMDNDDLKDNVSYDLEASEVARIVNWYGVLFESGSMPVVLEPWHPLDDRPYQVHTNRELALMLAGSKPLAAFVDVHPSVDGAFGIPEREFEPQLRG